MSLVRAGTVRWAATALLVGGILCLWLFVLRPRPKPNIIFIVVDALRADHLGSYGYTGVETPHLDRLAESSLFYENAYSNATWTVPSSASLFTATLPPVHRINKPPTQRFAFSVLADEYVLVGEALQAAGYRTGLLTTVGWVSPAAGYGQGVERFERSARTDVDLVELAKRYVSEHREERFHLYLHFIDLHDYYHPKRILSQQRAARLPPDSALLSLRGLAPRASYERLSKELSQPGRLTELDLSVLIESYDEALARTDALIGELAEHLTSEGIAESTLVVVTADHGEQFYEHQTLMHASDGFYNEVLRIPFFVSGSRPWVKPQRIETAISSVDFYPTLFALIDLEAPPEFQGAAVLREEPDRAVFATNGRTWKAITAEWSYILAENPSRDELFHLAADRREQHNLAAEGEHRKVREAMRHRIRLARKACDEHVYLRRLPNPSEAAMSEQERTALRALGYLD